MSVDDGDLRRMLEAEAEHAESTRDEPIPAEARATRPNRRRSVMFSVRLNPDELAAVQELAREQGVPASSLARGWLIQRIAAERSEPDDAKAAVERLEADVRTLRKLVTS